MHNWKSRDKVFGYLEDYTNVVKDQIDSGKTQNTLLKSYVFENFNENLTEPNKNENKNNLFIDNFVLSNYIEHEQIDENLYSLSRLKETIGFVEKIDSRFSVIYSIDNARKSDALANSLIKKNPSLDSLWISGRMFDSFLNKIRTMHSPNRYIKMKFEFDAFFEIPQLNNITNDNILLDDAFFDEKRVTTITINKEAREMDVNIKKIRDIFPEFYSVSLLKLPSLIGKGGHEFYQNGKVTNRSNSFKDHRTQIIDVVRDYKNVTEILEDNVWINFETIKTIDSKQSIGFQGTPVVFKFSNPLKITTFSNFVNYTFEKGKPPFRILGNPIWINEQRVHIYGLDLHIWQEVMLDMSPDEFTVFIPRGTCGNTIHRLVTNIQRFLDPGVQVFVGNKKYDDFISDVIQGSGLNE
ncbi:hypothetical protein GJU41_21370 [Bacillus idriensis]|uniref:Uncharacterized protein n=1 Tax=Metabacillus idriensis TaxID=324768 RepID=A0A6I2MH95_9BACI|nr:hypothetical protein [Metabacillus idriensis]MRX56502.1 hypothetical protein [Metabacillus idriensis]